MSERAMNDVSEDRTVVLLIVTYAPKV